MEGLVRTESRVIPSQSGLNNSAMRVVIYRTVRKSCGICVPVNTGGWECALKRAEVGVGEGENECGDRELREWI